MIKHAIQRAIGWHDLSPKEQYLRSYRFFGVVANLISLFPLPLPALLRWFGSDKQKAGWHNYGATYETLFRPWKYRRIDLLEIGIGGYGNSLGGTSLLAWQSFFPFGVIHGADIEDKMALASGRRDILILDQSSAPQLAELSRSLVSFDIIIDDGSHMSAHQIFTFERLFDSLKDDGIYVIEDVQTSFWPGLVANVVWDGSSIHDPSFTETCYGYFLELSKYLNQSEFIDKSVMNHRLASMALNIRQIAFEHNLIIIRKGDNREASTFVGRQ